MRPLRLMRPLPIRPFGLLLLIAAGSLAQGAIDSGFIQQNHTRLEQLFSSLKTDAPAIATATAQWQSGDEQMAAETLARYFEGRTIDPELLGPTPLPVDALEQADAALARSFYLLGRWETIPARPEGGLDWEHAGSGNDKESAWMLNRHAFLPALLLAWQTTGEPRYRDQLNALWQDWIHSSDYPGRITFSAQWRPLEVARRILNAWTHCFFADGALDPETRLLVLASLLDHADALRHHASFWGGNHLISEKLALLILAVAWPEFKDADEWASYAAERVSAQILEQTYPDGSYKELANHYQLIVLASARHLLRLLEPIDPAFRERPIYARVEAMWDFFAGSMRPDGFGPLNNDSDLENNAAVLRSVWLFHDRPDWLGMASNGMDGKLPAGPPSRFYPWAGQVFLRSGWNARAAWLYFDAGPYGSAHQHVDRLHVSLAAGGRLLLADTGRYTYQPGPWRDYFRGAAGHSVLRLNGRAADQAPRVVNEPLPIAFSELNGATFAAATAVFRAPPAGGLLPAMAAPVPWTRAVLMGPNGFTCIMDHLVTFSSQDVEARWHFAPGVSTDEAASIVVPCGTAVDLESELTIGRELPEPAGWHSDDYNRRVPVPMLSYRGRIDAPTTFVWCIRPPGAPERSVRILSQPGAPVLEMEWLEDGRATARVVVRLHPEPELVAFVEIP